MLWNKYLKEALAITRKDHPSRAVIIGPPFWNSIKRLPDLKLPKDDRMTLRTNPASPPNSQALASWRFLHPTHLCHAHLTKRPFFMASGRA